jgi:hypothetical protein
MDEDFIEVYTSVLPKPLVDRLIKHIDRVEEEQQLDHNKKFAGKGADQFNNKLDRDDFQVYLTANNEASLKDEVLDILMPYFQNYSDKYSIKTNGLIFEEIKIQKTKKYGNYSRWHTEQGGGAGWDQATRVLVWSVYLNDVPEAGETEFLFQQKRIKPIEGNLLVWPASYTHLHRGNPPIGGNKYIITGWGIYTYT